MDLKQAVELRAFFFLTLLVSLFSLADQVAFSSNGPGDALGGYALEFDGNDLAKADYTSLLDLTENNALTIEAWVVRRPVGFYWQCVLSKGNDQPYGLTVSEDQFLHFELSTSSNRVQLNTPAGSVPFDNWVHVAGTWDGTTMRAYVNGVESATEELDGLIEITSDPLIVGAARVSGGEAWNGLIDEVRVWNVDRTASQILDSMSVPLSGDEPGLVAYWRLDEATGQWAFDSTANSIKLCLGRSNDEEDRDPQWVAPLFGPISAHIEPAYPRTLDDLECITSWEREPEYPDSWWVYHWFRDGEELLEGMDVGGEFLSPSGPALSHYFTTRNETFYCVGRVTRDAVYYLNAMTDPVTIVNATPTAPVGVIIPENPEPSDSLAVVITRPSFDQDEDEVGYEFRWYQSSDGGHTFEYRLELSGIAPIGSWVPSAYLINGDVWRVEVVPFEAESPEIEGEIGWDQVYVGVNQRPVVVIDDPGLTSVITYASAAVSWRAEDADQDSMTVDLYYDTDRIEGGSTLIAGDLTAEGTISWDPPGAPGAPPFADLSGDGLLTANDLFLLAANWQADVEGTRYWIFARVWDSKGAIGEAFSSGSIVVPSETPGNREGLLSLLRQWHD